MKECQADAAAPVTIAFVGKYNKGGEDLKAREGDLKVEMPTNQW